MSASALRLERYYSPERGGDVVPQENKRPVRSCRENPSHTLTEESLLLLEKQQPHYRLSQRNLERWFYYLESTYQDTFDTFLGLPDDDYRPHWIKHCPSEISLSRADFVESHHSIASSTDLFGFTVRSPLPEPQVLIEVQTLPSLQPPRPQTLPLEPQNPQLRPSPSFSPSRQIPSRPRPRTAPPESTRPRESSPESLFLGFSPEPESEPQVKHEQVKRELTERAPFEFPSPKRLRPRKRSRRQRSPRRYTPDDFPADHISISSDSA
jgi:hypothetical protein